MVKFFKNPYIQEKILSIYEWNGMISWICFKTLLTEKKLGKTEGIAQVVEHLTSMHEVLGSVPSTSSENNKYTNLITPPHQKIFVLKSWEKL